jgi:hypothetical protein
MPGSEEEPLPAGWLSKVDQRSGKTYYINTVTKTTHWNRPTVDASVTAQAQPVADLPKGWLARTDKKSGRIYYINTVTKTTHWEKPTEPAKPVETVKVKEEQNNAEEQNNSVELATIDGEGSSVKIVIESETKEDLEDNTKHGTDDNAKVAITQVSSNLMVFDNQDDASSCYDNALSGKIPSAEEQAREDEEARKRREAKFRALEERIPHANPGCSDICTCTVM